MLQLSIDRLSLYKEISKLDRNLETLLNPHFIEQDFTKLECTIMKLDPWETLLSFICSSNNNITRISSMCESLCVIGGKKLTEMSIPIFEENPDTGELDFLENEIQPVYAFPSSELLFQKCQENSDPVEALKKLKFGYRAKYIINTIEKFLELKKVSGKATDAEFLLQNISPLNGTKKIDYAFAKYWLMQFSGVGPKVADCILLYSDISTLYKVKKEEVELELKSLTSTMEENMWNSIIPFDAHITRIALRDFPHIIKKSNSKNLELMKEDLMNQFGVYGGWIQVLLFTKEIEKNKFLKESIQDLQKNTKPKSIFGSANENSGFLNKNGPYTYVNDSNITQFFNSVNPKLFNHKVENVDANKANAFTSETTKQFKTQTMAQRSIFSTGKHSFPFETIKQIASESFQTISNSSAFDEFKVSYNNKVLPSSNFTTVMEQLISKFTKEYNGKDI
ncbi:unnamed protein product [Hanseniaspora opuntiae]